MVRDSDETDQYVYIRMHSERTRGRSFARLVVAVSSSPLLLRWQSASNWPKSNVLSHGPGTAERKVSRIVERNKSGKAEKRNDKEGERHSIVSISDASRSINSDRINPTTR